jgi:peptidoglycan/LPS O-acetylase OafA/YrhL
VQYAPYTLVLAGVLFFRSAIRQEIASGVELLLLSFLWGSLLVLALSPGIVRGVFSIAWLRWVGSISYGLYVYHGLFSELYDRLSTFLGPHWNYQTHHAVRFLLGFVLTFLVSWLSFRFIELPISGLKRKFQPKPARDSVDKLQLNGSKVRV